ncbi:hypothetical protein [Lyngbya sp. CCY1209]|uniref:hypothetical protein n=1 Tax=Lyngbya sp. CCY1209 TaxID=2886103 RepID=UPI002D20F08D|nr:hypothetical protein [Lyngbya sp. CCY1209]MEB3883071.1 hypothetical protein [Lyngbya sp. CCY1209]
MNSQASKRPLYLTGSHKVTVTRKTVRIGEYLYKTSDIFGFGVVTVNLSRSHRESDKPTLTKYLIAFALLLLSTLMLFLRRWYSVILGLILFSMSVAFPFFEVGDAAKKMVHGLRIFTPSGVDPILISEDVRGLREVLNRLQEFIEGDALRPFAFVVDEYKTRILPGRLIPEFPTEDDDIYYEATKQNISPPDPSDRP